MVTVNGDAFLSNRMRITLARQPVHGDDAPVADHTEPVSTTSLPTSPDLAAAQDWMLGHRLDPTDRCGRHDPLPGWSWRPQLRDYDLWLVRGGTGRAEIGGRHPIDLEAGTLLLLRPGDSGTVVQDDDNPVSVTFCHFQVWRGDRPVSIPGALTPGRVQRIEPDGPIASQLENLVRARSSSRPMAAVRARAHLLQVLAGIYALPGRGHRSDTEDLGRRAVAIVDAAPGVRHRAVDIAAELGVPARTIAPIFRAQVGMSFREYCLQSRLRRAQVLVGETDLPLTTIARMLGYADHTLLSKQFRARFGRSPRAYRRA